MTNFYYTAKDIEEFAAKGMRELEIGSGVFLTDFARETAQQLGIALVDSRKPTAVSKAPAPSSRQASVSDRYNKPTGCQHAPGSMSPVASSRAALPADQTLDDADPNTVNKLIDLMGKVIKRG